ncbi:MAG: hypothetical protein KatS3mg076_1714 [Candidatus Binatia bacterium]|nr:MAG: hypothetical protein KatS3mg076_1714 [Candidatus Binatia bacterium]
MRTLLLVAMLCALACCRNSIARNAAESLLGAEPTPAAEDEKTP